MGKHTKTDYSYDDLGDNRFRVRLLSKRDLLGRERSVEFEMPADWRYPQLRKRLEEEAERLRRGNK